MTPEQQEILFDAMSLTEHKAKSKTFLDGSDPFASVATDSSLDSYFHLSGKFTLDELKAIVAWKEHQLTLQGLNQLACSITDSELNGIVAINLASHPAIAKRIKQGDFIATTTMLRYCMNATKGVANPEQVKRMIIGKCHE